MTISRPIPSAPHRPASPIPLSPILSLEHTLQNTSSICPIPIPNKHLPVCPTGPSPADNQPDTPPASPPSKHHNIPSYSILYPADEYTKISSRKGEIYCLDAREVAAAINHIATQPLPESSDVFPWLHGLHAQNQIQQAFFIARRKALRQTPTCLRGITVIKADGDLSRCRLKGAIAPEEILNMSTPSTFKDIDPKDGFSVRNFQIQTCKMAMVSDVIVYGEDEVDTRTMAWKVAAAQQAWRDIHEKGAYDLPRYNTFICTTPFEDFETNHPELVVTTSRGKMTGNVMDFFFQERKEMSTMTAASEIAPNVWLGPTPDTLHANDFDIYIECGDTARLNPSIFENLTTVATYGPQYLELPSSGSIPPQSWDTQDASAILDAIVEAMQWIHTLATGISPLKTHDENDVGKFSTNARKILFHCTDGYTESSLMALAYFIFATGYTVAEAWLALHCTKKRNFFTYPTDVILLNALAPRLLAASPMLQSSTITPPNILKRLENQPAWLSMVDGSLPSRITEYMYLGNLTHANNPHLLQEMNIGQVLSVGEFANWEATDTEGWNEKDVMRIQNVQDNGIDELCGEFERCLEFIGMCLDSNPFASTLFAHED